MKTQSTSTESKTDSQSATTTSESYSDPASQAAAETPSEETETDELGYETSEEEVKPPVQEQKKEEAKAPAEEKGDGSSGYGNEEVPPTQEKKADETKTPEQISEEEKTKKEIEETLKDLGQGFDKNKIADFALKNKMTKEQVAAYAELVKTEEKELAAAREAAVKKQRAEWKQELQKDTTFGGDNFDANVARVEKFLEKNLPETKKMLTERRSMLPPYIMRDLLGLVKAMNPTNKFTGGEAPAPEENQDNSIEEFYA
jgi:hypothetical protein